MLLVEKAMATHSSTLAWKIPWTEEPVGCSPWGRWGLDTTEWLHFHFSLSCIGEGNGKRTCTGNGKNPLQCSCLENPRDGRAWWAAVYGVAQSQTQLKWLSSSSGIWEFKKHFKLWPSHIVNNHCLLCPCYEKPCQDLNNPQLGKDQTLSRTVKVDTSNAMYSSTFVFLNFSTMVPMWYFHSTEAWKCSLSHGSGVIKCSQHIFPQIPLMLLF